MRISIALAAGLCVCGALFFGYGSWKFSDAAFAGPVISENMAYFVMSTLCALLCILYVLFLGALGTELEMTPHGASYRNLMFGIKAKTRQLKPIRRVNFGREFGTGDSIIYRTDRFFLVIEERRSGQNN